MRLPIIMGLLFLTACVAPSEVLVIAEAPPAAPGELEAGQSQAFFAEYPDTLLTAAYAACNSPGQTPQQPDADTVRCQTLPTPDAAAALILSYNGTVEALPLYIVSFAAQPSAQGYLVTADSYVTVPQTDGNIRQVRLLDPRVETGMMELLVAAGGQPVG